MGIYNGFNGPDDVCGSFCLDDSDLNGVEILYAEYEREGYDGSAWVLFRKDNKLYEVNGSHCSCYGLEGQWEPTLTTVKALLMRPDLPKEVQQMFN